MDIKLLNNSIFKINYNNNNNDNYIISKKIIYENYLMANKNINEMLISSNLLYLNGKINNNKINIILDTGASKCVIFKSVIDKYGLNNLIDNNTTSLVQGVHGLISTYGKIWYLEIKLQLDNNEYIIVPINVEVVDDTTIINNLNNSTNNEQTNMHNFELILGMTFLKYYKAIINFSTMTLILNNNFKIKFN